MIKRFVVICAIAEPRMDKAYIVHALSLDHARDLFRDALNQLDIKPFCWEVFTVEATIVPQETPGSDN